MNFPPVEKEEEEIYEVNFVINCFGEREEKWRQKKSVGC